MPKGRQKGVKNKMTFNAYETAQSLGVDPLEFMLKMVKGDHKYFGFEEANKVSYTNAGIEFEEPNLKLEHRVKCATEAAKYLYSTKNAVDLTSGGETIKVILENFLK